MKAKTKKKIIHALENFLKKFLVAVMLWVVSFCTFGSIVCPFFENGDKLPLTISNIGALAITAIVCFITDDFENI